MHRLASSSRCCAGFVGRADLQELLHVAERLLAPVFKAWHWHGRLAAERVERKTRKTISALRLAPQRNGGLDQL